MEDEEAGKVRTGRARVPEHVAPACTEQAGRQACA